MLWLGREVAAIKMGLKKGAEFKPLEKLPTALSNYEKQYLVGTDEHKFLHLLRHFVFQKIIRQLNISEKVQMPDLNDQDFSVVKISAGRVFAELFECRLVLINELPLQTYICFSSQKEFAIVFWDCCFAAVDHGQLCGAIFPLETGIAAINDVVAVTRVKT